jgi:hypothetical protein
VIVRDPFPGNIIPSNRLNPVARNVLGFYPLPNQAGAADFTGNFFAEQPWTYSYYYTQAKIDHEWSQSHKTSVRFIRNFRREERYNWAGEQQGIDITARRHRPLQLERGARPHRDPEPDAGLRPARELPALQRRPDAGRDSQTLDLAELGFSARRSGCSAATRTSRSSTWTATPPAPRRRTRPNPVLCLGGNQNGYNSGRVQPFYNLQIAPTSPRRAGPTPSGSATTGAACVRTRSTRASAAAVPLRQHVHPPGQQRDGRYGQGIARSCSGLPTNDSFIETARRSRTRW